MGLFSIFNKEIAMDLGTANSIVMYNDQIVIDQPSVV
ncbi:MAG: rod shape-determining protein, partial [Bacteroidales bacterium]|nr:rod shape-determining protein [Bacteroidales bacterium]